MVGGGGVEWGARLSPATAGRGRVGGSGRFENRCEDRGLGVMRGSCAN